MLLTEQALSHKNINYYITSLTSRLTVGLHCRCKSEELEPLPLPEVRLLLHGHQQGGGAQAAAPEAGLHPGRGL